MKRIIERLKFLWAAPRLGPDMPLTYFLFFSRRLAHKICMRKFLYFGEGADFRLGAYAIETGKISLGRNVVIRPGTMLFATPQSDLSTQITIEDNAMLGSGVHIYVSNHVFNDVTKHIIQQGHQEARPVKIEAGAWIGANVVILPGVTIGKNAVIGAGSIVTKSIPDFCVAVGNPAKIIKELK
ncbi:acyltransferase [Vibrio cholerae]|uniref:Acyltransferase n=1 Tax=Vibrio cholerae TaxID=666 RepID=A0A7Z7YFQ3_VIBCL|nr:acyltransferase [Vibrio cholerae]PNV71058.1 acyltransferase [Vibrio cholerae]TBM44704.1 acyltransferase [Vibrio cholerae]